MPRPAPSATTRVCSTPIAELKNAICFVTKIADLLFFVDLLFSDKTQKKNKPFFVGLLYCDFGFSFLCFSWWSLLGLSFFISPAHQWESVFSSSYLFLQSKRAIPWISEMAPKVGLYSCYEIKCGVLGSIPWQYGQPEPFCRLFTVLFQWCPFSHFHQTFRFV